MIFYPPFLPLSPYVTLLFLTIQTACVGSLWLAPLELEKGEVLVDLTMGPIHQTPDHSKEHPPTLVKAPAVEAHAVELETQALARAVPLLPPPPGPLSADTKSYLVSVVERLSIRSGKSAKIPISLNPHHRSLYCKCDPLAAEASCGPRGRRQS